MAKYFFIAGEASGDMHAAALISAIRRRDKKSVFVGFGGDKMQSAGCRLVCHYRNMAFMGVVDVVMHAPDVVRNLRLARRTMTEEKPDALVLVDYPSFNLKIAKFCRRRLPQTKIYYYISPKVWAWKTWRVHTIAKLTDRVLCIFPFESEFYARYGYKATYVGNPTANYVKAFMKNNSQVERKSNVVALLPGSRKHEVQKCLPRMLAAASSFINVKVVIAKAPSLPTELYEQIVEQTRDKYKLGQLNIEFREDTYHLLLEAALAVVNSGTATLETALLGCPQVAVYHVDCGHLLNLVRPLLFKLNYFTLPNIIAGKQVIRELLAYEFTVDTLKKEIEHLLIDDDYRMQMLYDYKLISDILGDLDASETAAELCCNNIKNLRLSSLM